MFLIKEKKYVKGDLKCLIYASHSFLSFPHWCKKKKVTNLHLLLCCKVKKNVKDTQSAICAERTELTEGTTMASKGWSWSRLLEGNIFFLLSSFPNFCFSTHFSLTHPFFLNLSNTHARHVNRRRWYLSTLNFVLINIKLF